jgi:hypothetical protein
MRRDTAWLHFCLAWLQVFPVLPSNHVGLAKQNCYHTALYARLDASGFEAESENEILHSYIIIQGDGTG